MDLGDALIEGLGISPPSHVALVGGGGKTTLMLALRAAGLRRGWRSLAGTTTRVAAVQVSALPDFIWSTIDGSKLVGPAPEQFDEVFASGEVDLLVVEADGSRSKVVKAPADHEPVVPASATLVIAVIGADALDRVIEDVAHRPMRLAALCGCGPYERLTPVRASQALASARGGRKGVPAAAGFAVAITRIGPRQEDVAARLAAGLADAGVRSVRLRWE